jgi:hypothetical protein
MATHFLVTIVDCKEFFEYTPGILRCFVKPKHFDSLSFNLHPVIENRMGCKFIWGEVMKLENNQTATIKPMFQEEVEVIDFDFCIIASGCNFAPFDPMNPTMMGGSGESLWFPVVHAQERKVSKWAQFDERFIEGRRRHIFDEYNRVKQLEDKAADILVIGAGFIGVEWVTELQHFFPKLNLKIIDFLPTCLGPLPPGAARYCNKYMERNGIQQFYEQKFDNSDKFFEGIKYEGSKRPDKVYDCRGVKASNYFMPADTLSTQGPGGGKWILMDLTLAVTSQDKDEEGKPKPPQVWCKDDKGFPRIFAVGDCNYSCIPKDGEKNPSKWTMPPIPKISYPGEEEAVIAARNVDKIEALYYGNKTTDCCGGALEIHPMHWPWGAGMFATSLGPHDACFVAGANYNKHSGYTVLWGQLSAVQKEFIEHSKVNECEMGLVGRCIWHFVHHTPLHLWGGGPRWGY